MEMVKKRSSFSIFSITRGCVTLVALPFTLEKYLKAKEEVLWKLKYFNICKKYNLQKIF